ncbi:hypothetical protein IT575_14110 [bacterium]|nr:hypothetical protein [bacterium]
MLQELELAFAAQTELELWQPLELSTREQWPQLRKIKPGSVEGVSAMAEWTTGTLTHDRWQRLAEACGQCAAHMDKDAVRHELLAAEASDWLGPAASSISCQDQAVCEQLFTARLEAAQRACGKD